MIRNFRIQLYILREVIPVFLIGMLVSSFILVIFQVLKLSEMIFEYGASFKTLFMTFIFLVPPFFNFTIPISILLSVIIGFARLSSDEEYTAMAASGISLFNLIPSMFYFSLFWFVLTVLSSSFLDPWSKKYINQYLMNEVKSKVGVVLKSKLKQGVFIRDFFGQILYVDKIEDNNSDLSEIFLATDKKKSQGFTFAKKGKILSDDQTNIVILRLLDGVHHISLKKDAYEMMKFEYGDLNLVQLFENSIELEERRVDYDYQSMYPDEMLYYIDQQQHLEKDRHYYRAIFILNQKVSLPFTCILFALLGIPLGIQNPRSGKSKGYVIGLGIILIYYIIMMIGKSYAERGRFDPFFAAWAPNVVFLIFTLWYFVKKANAMALEPPFSKLMDMIALQVEKLMNKIRK